MNQISVLPKSVIDHASTDRRPWRIAIIAASWHREIVSRGTNSIREELVRLKVLGENIVLVEVPGAFEIPLHAKKLALSGSFDAIIACALIVNGGIYRHEFVSSAVIDGLMRVQLDTHVPITSAVLTPRDFHNSEEHQGFFQEHFVK
jgi:6,7-dimethyl-8-ribityllumazine synthase